MLVTGDFKADSILIYTVNWVEDYLFELIINNKSLKIKKEADVLK